MMSSPHMIGPADRESRPDPAAITVSERLRRLRVRAGMTRDQLAKAAGFRGASSIQRYEEPGKFHRDWLDPDLLDRLAPVLVGRGRPPITEPEVYALGYRRDISVDTDTYPYVAGETPLAALPPPNANIAPGIIIESRGRIPVYGASLGGEFDEVAMNRIRDADAPPILSGVADAYAVQISGDTMEPRYSAGEIVYVHPGLAIRHGDYVVAQVSDESGPLVAYVKKFVAITDDEVVMMHFSPAEHIVLPRAKVRSIHRIVMAGEG